MEIHLAVGKKFKNRRGDIITITRPNPNWAYPFIGMNEGGFTEKFTLNGKYLRYETDPRDLIEEIIENKVEEKEDTVAYHIKRLEELTGKKVTITLS